MGQTKRDIKPRKKNEPIVIDEEKGWTFDTEEELLKHFEADVRTLEEDFLARRPQDDILLEDFQRYEDCLSFLLADPLEVWHDLDALKGSGLHTYIGEYEDEKDKETIYYVAQVYVSHGEPTFIYLHFPTKNSEFLKTFRKGRMIFDHTRKDAPMGAAEGDALGEGDELAVGLYNAMTKLRNDKDIQEHDFLAYVLLRESTIEEPDEIWRNRDFQGNVLVSFIREYHDYDERGDLYYIVITVEEAASNSHSLLFSFPTRDTNLVDRYRHGENLQADEVSQEASH